jgi:hypothetical protein
MTENIIEFFDLLKQSHCKQPFSEVLKTDLLRVAVQRRLSLRPENVLTHHKAY